MSDNNISLDFETIYEKKNLDLRLDEVSYKDQEDYIPSKFALDFVTFIKLVNGGKGEENKTPVIHLRMLDNITGDTQDIINVLFRGAAKTTLMAEYLFLYIAIFGEIEGFGKVAFAIYVSDSMENGVKSLRKNIEYRWKNSEFLQKHIPEASFTDARIEFYNTANQSLVIRMFGAKALSLDTRLFTEDGFTTIGECKVGDSVFGPDGKLHPITLKSEVFNKPMYRLLLGDGRELKVSEDHINNVLVDTSPSMKDGPKEFNYTTRELLKLDLTSTQKSSIGTSLAHLVWIRNTEPMQYKTKKYDINPYLMGLILGGGYIEEDGSCVLHGEVSDIEFYKNYIDEVFVSEYLSNPNMNVISFSENGKSQGLLNCGIAGIKISEKFVPQEYKVGSVEQRLALLQGILDTDGTISTTARVLFSNTSKQLIDDVSDIVRSLGGTSYYLLAREATEKCDAEYRIEILMPMNPFRLGRKKERWLYNGSQKHMVSLDKIELISTEPSQCIAIDSHDHLYLAGDYITTHNTGVRGTREKGSRVDLVVLDDIISDADAKSPTIIESIEATVNFAVEHATKPKKKIIWNGTPFNQKDPLYKAVESGGWEVNAYPICESFDENTKKKDFHGAWEDRFDYDFVRRQFLKARASGDVAGFYQELMLRVVSNDQKLIQDNEVLFYDNTKRKDEEFVNFITTDFATTAKTSGDFTTIGVWGYDDASKWHLRDGMIGKYTMDYNIDILFSLVEKYNVHVVGVEVTGQQGAFVDWIKREMGMRGIFFSIVSVRPTVDKLSRLHIVSPHFKKGNILIAEELRNHPLVIELISELKGTTFSSIRSKNDDALDMLSMIMNLTPWSPGTKSKDAIIHEGLKDNPFLERVKLVEPGNTSYDLYT